MFIFVLDNPVKFSNPNGKISINAAVAKTNELWISVTDTGVGISEGPLVDILKPIR